MKKWCHFCGTTSFRVSKTTVECKKLPIPVGELEGASARLE